MTALILRSWKHAGSEARRGYASRRAGTANRVRPVRRKEPKVSWEDKAACAGTDALLFYGPDKEAWPERESREEKAKAVCASCRVRAECLDYALANSIKYGIWGGLNENERVRERRRRARRPNAAPAA
jgi:WhiB family transcriptional regulator, redox-sensing transcriptional regulator